MQYPCTVLCSDELTLCCTVLCWADRVCAADVEVPAKKKPARSRKKAVAAVKDDPAGSEASAGETIGLGLANVS